MARAGSGPHPNRAGATFPRLKYRYFTAFGSACYDAAAEQTAVGDEGSILCSRVWVDYKRGGVTAGAPDYYPYGNSGSRLFCLYRTPGIVFARSRRQLHR